MEATPSRLSLLTTAIGKERQRSWKKVVGSSTSRDKANATFPEARWVWYNTRFRERYNTSCRSKMRGLGCMTPSLQVKENLTCKTFIYARELCTGVAR